NVFSRVSCHQIRQTDIAQNRQSSAAHSGLAGEAHDRYSHPEGVARGGAAAVRKRIQRDVDLEVRRLKFRNREERQKAQARWLDVPLGDKIRDSLSMAAGMSVQNQFR